MDQPLAGMGSSSSSTIGRAKDLKPAFLNAEYWIAE